MFRGFPPRRLSGPSEGKNNSQAYGNERWLWESRFWRLWGSVSTRNEKQPEVFLTEIMQNPFGSWTSAPSGYGCLHQKVCVSRLSKATEAFVGSSQKGGFQKGGFGRCSPVPKTGTRVHPDVPWNQKQERGYIRMFPGTKNRNKGTFAKTDLLPTALLFPLDFSGTEKGVITKGVFWLEKSLASLKSLNSLESLENARNLLCFPQSGGSLKTLDRERKFSPKFFWPKFLEIPWGRGRPRLRVMDIRARMLVFSRILTALTEVLGRDIRANGPRMSAGCPSQKLPLWADFSFLTWSSKFSRISRKWTFLRRPLFPSLMGGGCMFTLKTLSALINQWGFFPR